MGVTNVGKAGAATLLKTGYTYMAYGSSNTAYAAAQTGLQGTEFNRAAATCSTTTTTVSGDTAQWVKQFTCANASGESVGEVGIFDAAASGNMLARSTTAKTLALSDTYTVTYKVVCG